MTQYARPSSDISVGIWYESAGSSQTNIYTAIDEAVRADGDYVYSAANGTGACTIQLSAIDDPAVSTDHVLSYTYTRYVSNKNMTLVVTLYSGVTSIASYTHANPSTDFNLAQQTLAASDADTISDYADLRLQLNVTINGGAGQYGAVSWAEFATPDASGNINIPATASTIIWTGASGSVTPGAVSVAGAAASFVWTSPSATITNVPPARIITGAAGTNVFTGLSAAVVPGAVSVPANAGTLIFTGASGQAITTRFINANTGSQVYTAPAGAVTPGAVSIPTTSGVIVFSGASASVSVPAGPNINAAAGAFVWTGTTALVTAVLVRAIVTISDSVVYVVSVSDYSP